MNRNIVQQHQAFQHAASARSPNHGSNQVLNSDKGEKTVVAPARQMRKSRHTDFDPEWHDAKEIVVPFDESSFSGLLVDEKTFQAAYSRNRPPPKVDNLRLDTMRTIGKVVVPDWWDDFLAFCNALLIFVEFLVLVWTAALLLYGFPISKWLSWTLVCVWPLTLITFKFVMAKPKSCRIFLWCGTCVTTVSWLVWSPWSHEFIARFPAYFFRT